jgi:hypothetical protein
MPPCLRGAIGEAAPTPSVSTATSAPSGERVALGLAAFSGFYFAIAISTDSTYRAEFLDELTSEMRASFEERAAYLRLRERVR